jgi:transposase InsO family protein
VNCSIRKNTKYGKRQGRDIFWYIEIYYNNQRRNQAIGYKIPSQFRKGLNILMAS